MASTLEIDISLDKDFITQYNALQNEFGEKIAKLNGFADSQLSYTDFIDNFIDKNGTVADKSVDANSNVSHKDIVCLEREMAKPHAKVLAFNKIYYEIKKKFGFFKANQWLRAEWIGQLYMHDACSASFRSYCFTGDTKILTNYGIKRLDELVNIPIMVLNKNHGWEQATVQYFGKQTMRLLTLERYGNTKTIAVTGNHKWFCKYKKSDHGCIVLSTDELKEGMKIPYNTSKVWSMVEPSPFGVAHGFFTGDGYKNPDRPRANFCGDKTALIPYFSPAPIGGNEHEYTMQLCPRYFNYLPPLTEAPSYLYGWLSGYFAADGSVDTRGRCTIASTDISILEFARDVLCILGMPVNEIRFQDRVSNLTGEMGRVYILTLSEEYLKDDFFIRPQHKERIAANRKLDRKERWWNVVSVVDTNTEMDCFCAVVPGTESFTLDNNILTHNCFAYSLKDLAEKGLYFDGDDSAKPAKHLITFIDFVKEFVNFASNRTSGAKLPMAPLGSNSLAK